MPSPGIFKKALTFAATHERRLGAALFAFGFIIDLFTFGLLPPGVVSYFFIAYLFLAAGSSIGAHYFAGIAQNEKESWLRRTLSVGFPLLVQYAFGGLLSGLVVFYAANSFIAASWPFLLLLAVMYLGNEYFRMYKHYLVFQTTLFFFTLYAYSIFGLPLLLNTLGPLVFVGSTLLALCIFAVFLYLLHLANKGRLKTALKQIYISTGVMVALVVGSYFAGLIPPIPLALGDTGIYHSITKIEGGYRVSREEEKPWWNIFPPTIHHVPGRYVYVYSAVAAPIRFGTNVSHRWERNIPGKGWTIDSEVSFPIAGGREGGYRGYSMRSNLIEGPWRVSVVAPGGQIIGRIYFEIDVVEELPALTQETL